MTNHIRPNSTVVTDGLTREMAEQARMIIQSDFPHFDWHTENKWTVESGESQDVFVVAGILPRDAKGHTDDRLVNILRSFASGVVKTLRWTQA